MKRKVKVWRIRSASIRWWVEQSPTETRTCSTSDYIVGIVLSRQPGCCNVVIRAKDPDEAAQQYYDYFREMIDTVEVLSVDSGNGIRF